MNEENPNSRDFIYTNYIKIHIERKLNFKRNIGLKVN